MNKPVHSVYYYVLSPGTADVIRMNFGRVSPPNQALPEASEFFSTILKRLTSR